MPRSRLEFEQVSDTEFASQSELDQVKDNNSSPVQFVASTMNNYELWLKSNILDLRSSDGNFTFYTPGSLTPYVEIGETSWKSFATFIYRGTTIWTPTQIQFVASRSKPNGTSSFRIYDITNNNTIVTHDFSEEVITLHDDIGVLSNLPLNASIFECQAQRNASNAGTTRIHALGVYP